MKVEQCPRDGLTEIAVIGRSNVGKSSLINALTRSEGLAKVSKTPGKTRTINHFLINGQWYLVDLPGYGFAERQASEREVLQEFTREYFLDRKNLATVLLLVDSSVEPQQIDLDALAWMGENQIPVSLVFTKIDKKRKGSSNADNIKAFKEAVGRNWCESLARLCPPARPMRRNACMYLRARVPEEESASATVHSCR